MTSTPMRNACRKYISYQKKVGKESKNVFFKWIFGNTSQNRKAVKSERDRRSCTKFSTKGPPTNCQDTKIERIHTTSKKNDSTLISRYIYILKSKKSRRNVKIDFRNSSQNRKAVKTERDGRSNTKCNLISLPSLLTRFNK